MQRQRGHARIAGIFLTFSLLLVVLAVGFVVGRLMVARSYAQAAPKIERRDVEGPAVSAELPEEGMALPGSVYVPPPVPPQETPDDLPTGETAEDEAPGAPASPIAPGSETAAAAAPRETSPETRVSLPPPRDLATTDEPEGARYSVQVGIFTVREGARQVADELTRAGYPAEIAVKTTAGQTLYRVLTGRYRTEYAARKALEELQREGFPGFLVER